MLQEELTFLPNSSAKKGETAGGSPKDSVHTPSGYSEAFLRQLYKSLIKPRLIEERMLLLLRQGKVSKWFSGIGQEGVSVGAAMALDEDDYILTLHRNLGVFTVRDVPLWKLMAQWQGKATGFTNGRDRSFHFGSNEHHIVGMISHLGPQLAVADGIALAERIKQSKKISLVFTGEGGTSEGDFHEALNVASVWELPVIFIVENNGYALSTPTSEQYRCKHLSDRAAGYGIEGITIDGNNALEVYEAVYRAASHIRRVPRPVLIECVTFRMRGHEEASGTKYVPQYLFDEWQQKDPIRRLEEYLIGERIIDSTFIGQVRSEIGQEIDTAVERAFSEEEPKVHPDRELHDVYALFTTLVTEPTGETKSLRFVDAISSGLNEAMERYPELIIMGQDIAEYGGVFKVTEGFVEKYGSSRVRNTPLCESAIVGAALGLSIRGIKSIVEMQFADFVSSGFTQIANNLAKSHYRWKQPADVVVRMPTGAGMGAGPFHSQSNETWFTHVPGLKVVYPSNPADAKGLLLRSVEDPNPVMFFEHKGLYRSVSGEVPEGYYTIPFGVANVLREGTQISVITYGMGVQWATKVLAKHPKISCHLLDLRTLVPLDWDAIVRAVEATGKVIVLHEDTLFGGIGGEIIAYIAENCLNMLDAPPVRCGSLDTPVPFASALEQSFLPVERFERELLRLARY